MKIFRSRQEKRFARDLVIRRGLSEIRRSVRQLDKHEEGFADKARRASALGARDQLEFIRSTLQRTAVQKRLLERQLLSLETALQVKDQAESHARFCQSMAQLARSVSSSFREADLARTQENFLKSMVEAREMEDRLGCLLDQTESILGDTDLDSRPTSDDGWLDQVLSEAESRIESRESRG